MTYQRQVWRNHDRATPLNEDRLNHIEEGISGAYALVGIPGPKGDPGDASAIPAMFSGPYDPPELVVGSKPGDTWLNTATGDTFILR